LTRIPRTSLIMFDNDVADQLFWSHHSQPRNDCCSSTWNATSSAVLLHMKYFIKMAHGISDSFYHVLPDYLLYGTGQGSGASPSVWLSLVVILSLHSRF
jgi:hypothetical protein